MSCLMLWCLRISGISSSWWTRRFVRKTSITGWSRRSAGLPNSSHNRVVIRGRDLLLDLKFHYTRKEDLHQLSVPNASSTTTILVIVAMTTVMWLLVLQQLQFRISLLGRNREASQWYASIVVIQDIMLISVRSLGVWRTFQPRTTPMFQHRRHVLIMLQQQKLRMHQMWFWVRFLLTLYPQLCFLIPVLHIPFCLKVLRVIMGWKLLVLGDLY